MAKVTLWGAGTARSLRPIWVAEELGLAYELKPIGPRSGETRTPEYTRLTRKQKIPYMQDGDVGLSESVAICRYLVEAYPNGNIWSPVTLAERAKMDEWCCYVYGDIDESGLYVMRRHGDLAQIYGGAPDVVASAADYVRRHLDVLSEHLRGREFLMDGGFGLADLLLQTCLDWAVHCRIGLPAGLETYRRSIATRPAYRKAMAINYPAEVLAKRL